MKKNKLYKISTSKLWNNYNYVNKIIIFSFFLKYIAGCSIFLCKKKADF